jgi:phosphoribosylamine---glycine ligase
MKILVIGGGGREHAMAWMLKQSVSATKVWCAPGNDGIARDVECVPLDLKDVGATADLATRLGADLTVVGPEMPLVLGIGEEFAKRGLTLLGPGRQAAQLEGSKIFSKQFMERHKIPTAGVYGMCDSTADARAKLDAAKWPMVVKADGLCAGKGVLVAKTQSEATDFIGRVMDKGEFGDAGNRVLLEEGLAGDELSYIILTDGKDFIRMAPARDHKRAYDNDEGPNTGGMGAYSTDDILPAALERRIIETIVGPTLEGIAADGMAYRGFLYFGLMLTGEGPKVLEYNCRLGDPETEAVMLRGDFDFADACMRAARGELRGFEAKWLPGPSICVVIASKGYPGDPKTGLSIEGLADAAQVKGAVVFHAATKRDGATLRTTGGRVLVVSARGTDLREARGIAYEAVGKIKIEGAHFRKDIGKRALEEAGVSARRIAMETAKTAKS